MTKNIFSQIEKLKAEIYAAHPDNYVLFGICESHLEAAKKAVESTAKVEGKEQEVKQK